MKVYSLGSLDVLGAAHALSDLPQFVFLDSASRHAVLGRYSFVAADPFGTFTVDDGVAFWNGEAFAGHPVPALKSLLARFGQSTLPGLPPFQGGAAGFFGYQFGRVLRSCLRAVTEMRCPDAVLHFFDAVLAFDHVANRGWLISTGWPGPAEQDRARRAGERAEFFLDRLVMPSPPDRRSARLQIGARTSPRKATPRPSARLSTTYVPVTSSRPISRSDSRQASRRSSIHSPSIARCVLLTLPLLVPC